MGTPFIELLLYCPYETKEVCLLSTIESCFNPTSLNLSAAKQVVQAVDIKSGSNTYSMLVFCKKV